MERIVPVRDSTSDVSILDRSQKKKDLRIDIRAANVFHLIKLCAANVFRDRITQVTLFAMRWRRIPQVRVKSLQGNY